MSEPLRKARAAVASSARCGPGLVEMAFDLHNPEAANYARTRGGNLIREITREARQAVRNVIARGIEQGLAPRVQANLIRSIVGLTDRQADSVLNFRDRLEKQGWSGARLEAAMDRYATKVHKRRALTIARTETMRASNEGQRILWRQAQQRGHLKKDAAREWITTADKRTCPVCMPLDGEVQPMDGLFGGQFSTPPAHPQCRCTTALAPGAGVGVANPLPEPSADADVSSAGVRTRGAPPLGTAAPLPPEKIGRGLVPKETPYPANAAEAQAIKDEFGALAAELKDRKVLVQGMEDALLDVATNAGRKNIMIMHTSQHSALVGMDRMIAAGVKPQKVKMLYGPYMNADGTPNTSVTASHTAFKKGLLGKGTTEITINTGSNQWGSWEHLTDAAERGAMTGWHPQGIGPGSTWVHEYGHFQHEAQRRGGGEKGSAYDSWRAWDTTPPEIRARGRSVAGRVSDYAATNSREFVAETWTGMLHGQKYDDEVLDQYLALGGPVWEKGPMFKGHRR